jgi:hypothetical protein
LNASNDSTAATGLRGWWASPPRQGPRRLIAPWEYRHLRLFGAMRAVVGCVLAGIGAVVLSHSAYAWAALFLALAALSLATGYWYLTLARSETA